MRSWAQRGSAYLWACVNQSTGRCSIDRTCFEVADQVQSVPRFEYHAAAYAVAAASTCFAATFLVSQSNCDGPNSTDAATGVKQSFHILPDDVQKRTFFKYEKRIRELSTHEKVFQYFSTSSKDRNTMTPVEMLRALIAIYPPENATWHRSGSLAGESSVGEDITYTRLDKSMIEFFDQFDVDGDGAMTYPEFLLVLALLSVPLRDMHSIFSLIDTDGNGTVEQAEFCSLIDSLESAARKTSSLLPRSGFQPGADRPSNGLMKLWFGVDGDQNLKLEDFAAFLVKLHRVFEELEFDVLDVENKGSISGLDLARSLVAPAGVRIVDRLLDRTEALPLHLKSTRIDRDMWNSVQQMRDKYHRLSFAMRFWQGAGQLIDEHQLVRFIQSNSKVTISHEVAQILIHVFMDDDGRFDMYALQQALKYKFGHLSKNDETGTWKEDGIIACVIDCFSPSQP